MICKACKEEVKNGSIFCTHCGYFLNGKGAPEPKDTPEEEDEFETDEDEEEDEDDE